MNEVLNPEAAPELGRKVGAGMIFMVLSAFANRGVALVTQAILGMLLTKADFGVFAIATAAASVAVTFRDGGLRFVLLQRGPTEYERLSAPVFWVSLAFNAGTALLIGAAAPLVADVYDDGRLTTMLLLIATTVPVGTHPRDLRNAPAGGPSFQSDRRHRHLVRRHPLRRHRCDRLRERRPLSMVYGLLAATAFETVAMYVAAPGRPWAGSPRTDLWGALLREGKWTMTQGLAVSTIYFGMYASMGLFVSKDLVGVYSWAFAILTQSGHLVANQFESVLLPSIVRLQHDVARRRAAGTPVAARHGSQLPAAQPLHRSDLRAGRGPNLA